MLCLLHKIYILFLTGGKGGRGRGRGKGGRGMMRGGRGRNRGRGRMDMGMDDDHNADMDNGVKSIFKLVKQSLHVKKINKVSL